MTRWSTLAPWLLGMIAALALAAACRAEDLPASDELPAGAVAPLGTDRFRHKHTVVALDWSRDGQWLVSASWDRTSRVWDTASGREVAQIKLPEGGSAVAVAPDKSMVAAGYMKRGVIVWDPKTGKEVRRIEGNENTPFYLTWSADGGRLVWVAGKTIRVWDAVNWKEERAIRPQLVKDEIRPAAISADAKWAVTVRDDKVDLWSLDSGERVKTIEVHRSRVRSVVFGGDAAVLGTTAQDGMLRVIDLKRGVVVREFEAAMGEDPGWKLRFIDKDRRIVAGGQQGVLRVWDVAKGALVEEVRPSGRTDLWTMAMALAPDGRTLATCGTDKAIRMWDVTGANFRRLDFAHSDSINSAVFADGGKTVATASDDGQVMLWDAPSGKRRGQLEGTGRTNLQMASDLAGKVLAVSNEDPGLSIFDGATFGKRAALTDRLVAMHNVAMSADGAIVAAVERHATVRIIDARTGEERTRIAINPRMYAEMPLAVSPDGRMVAVGSGDPDKDKDVVRLHDARDGREVRVLDVGAGSKLNASASGALAWSADGAMIAVAGWGKPIELWEVATGKRRCKIEGDGDAGTCVAFSPNGRYLAAGGGPDKPTVRVWELPSCKLVAKFAGGHRGWLKRVAWSLDSRRLVSCGEDTVAYVWDAGTAAGTWMTREADLDGGKLDEAVARLGDEDPAVAWQAMQVLAARAERAVKMLANTIRLNGIGEGAAAVDADHAARVTELIEQLDADTFSTRDKAQRELAKLGESAGPAMRKALGVTQSDEVRTRLGVLVASLSREEALRTADDLRAMRGIELLERIGSPEARVALEQLVKTRPGSLMADRAAQAIKRLKQ